MPDLEPTPDLLATARRANGRDWTVGPEGAIEMETNQALAQLVGVGYVRMHFTAAYKRADDYWTLTEAGRVWLAEHDTTTRD